MNDYAKRLRAAIPGGAHTYSRGRDQFSQNSPVIAENAKGCYLLDSDGNKFIDYGMGLRSIILGYANDEVNEAAIEALSRGNCFTIPHTGELFAAEKLIEIIENIEMVKFCKNGSNATTAAVKLARAYTGKNKILKCLEHPFFSFDDWFIGTTPLTRGIPKNTYEDTMSFSYSSVEQVDQFIQSDPDIACLIMEPAAAKCPSFDPKTCNNCTCTDTNFENTNIKEIQDLCKKNGVVFILDETITGFRWDLQGAQKIMGLSPDLTIFGKGMANGFSLACVGGKKEIMDIGSIDTLGSERVFLLSSTHGAEATSLAAFVKTVEITIRDDVCNKLWKIGQIIKNGFNRASTEQGLQDKVFMFGPAVTPVANFFDNNGQPDFLLRTFFIQELVKHKILMPWVSPSLAHNSAVLDQTIDAFNSVMKKIRISLDSSTLKDETLGPPVKPVFRKYN